MYNIYNIAFRDIAFNGKIGWFINIGYNAIMQLDCETGNVYFEAFFPEDKWGIFELFSSIEYFDGKLYIAPKIDNRLCIYTIEDQSFEFIEIKLNDYKDNTSRLFNSVKEVEGNIFFFPGRYNAIVKLNPIDKSLEYLGNWHKGLRQTWDNIDENMVIFSKIHSEGNNNFLMPCCRSNTIMIFNTNDKKCSLKKINNKGLLLDYEAIDNSSLYSIQNKAELYFVNDTCKNISISTPQKDGSGWFIYKGKKNYCAISLFGEEIVFIDATSSNMVRIETFSERIKEQDWLVYNHLSTCSKKIDDERLFVYLNRSNELLEINIDTCDIKKRRIHLCVNYEERFLEHIKRILKEQVILEVEGYSIRKYISII